MFLNDINFANYNFAIVLGQTINIKDALLFSISKSSDILLLLISSLVMRWILEKSGQRWIRTFSQTVTLIVLPIITYIITSVISGNIALSLGMVGALSIVRFRNPVRSPFELSVYFSAITMGIAASANINWLFLIILVMSSLSIFIKYYSASYKNFTKLEFFNTSFSEGNNLSTLEITTKEKIALLNDSRFLKSKSVKNELYNYLLASDDFTSLKEISDQLENDKNTIAFTLNE